MCQLKSEGRRGTVQLHDSQAEGILTYFRESQFLFSSGLHVLGGNSALLKIHQFNYHSHLITRLKHSD